MAAHVIDNYELVSELGRGGMGIVYKARDLTLQREVAVKILSPHLAGDPQFVARFLLEARAAAQLSHPNIAHVYAVGETRGCYYIAMEYVKGKSLAHWIRSMGTIDAPRALRVVREVAQALSVAHASGIIHRDIKPANIMIDETGHVKIMDFGLAKVQDSTAGLTTAGAVLGTPSYMAPEQIQGDPVDERADIYALGITFYEMIAGHPPFCGEPPLALMYKIIHEELPSLDSVAPASPRVVRDVIAWMTAKKTTERPPSGNALLLELERISSGQQTTFTERAPGLRKRLAGERRITAVKSRWTILAVSALILAAVAAALAARARGFGEARNAAAVADAMRDSNAQPVQADPSVNVDPAEAPDAEQPQPASPPSLVGIWRLEEEGSDPVLASFSEDKFTFDSAHEFFKGTYLVDTSRVPPVLVFMITRIGSGPQPRENAQEVDERALALYRITGEQIEIAVNRPGSEEVPRGFQKGERNLKGVLQK